MGSGEVPNPREHGASAVTSIRDAISRRIVQLMKEFYGRGPVGTRTYYHDDYVLVLLAGGFSKVEDTLMAAGRGAAVADQREQFQEMMRGRFVEAIEEITGRSVVSFMSANDQEGDAMAELFLLRPIRETVDPPEQT